MKIKLIAAFGLLVFVLIWALLSIYPDWLWFENLHFSSVFWTMMLSRLGLGIAIWIVFILITSICLLVARRLSRDPNLGKPMETDVTLLSQLGISESAANLLFLALVLIVGLFVASKGSDQWHRVLSYFFQYNFGSSDPIFNRGISFYVFSLPFYLILQKGLLSLFFLSGLIVLVWYL